MLVIKWIFWSVAFLYAIVLVIAAFIGFKERYEKQISTTGDQTYTSLLIMLLAGAGIIYLCVTNIPSDYSSKDTKEPSTIDNVYYSNCTDAREAGVAPIYKGEPGYRVGLDRDRDGIACER